MNPLKSCIATNTGSTFHNTYILPSNEKFETMDLFEPLHDSILLHIFNKIRDVKALGRCSVVCKRFLSLIFLVDTVTVKVDCVISGEESSLSLNGGGVFANLVRFVVGSIAKPLQVLQHMIGPKKSMFAEVSHHFPVHVLKNFKAIQSLRIELPGGELGVEDGVLLKWKAEFGSTLDNCTILGASSLIKLETQEGNNFEFGKPWFLQARCQDQVTDQRENEGMDQDDDGSLPESFYTNGGLKLRVVWTISSLIAASARHFLLQQIIFEHPTLTSLVFTDVDGQGLLYMDKMQLQEFRSKPLAASASANRTQIPALNMKLWYAPYLVLPNGTRMNGATLVSIRPIDQPVHRGIDAFASTNFEEPFKTAATQLMKRRTYLLEMNSF